MRNPRHPSWLAVALSVTMVLAAGSACRRVVERLPGMRSASDASGAFGSRRDARDVVRRAIEAYHGMDAWKQGEGLELKMVWKEYVGTRVDENPALVQLRFGSPRQIRIHLEKLDHVFGLGDQGPWVMVRGQADRNPEFIAKARYATMITSFFLSLPYVLTEPEVSLRGAMTQTYAGTVYDIVTIGFTGTGYPWPDDTMQLWFRQSNLLLERCYFVSTAQYSEFGPPPNYLWIEWSDHSTDSGLPLARKWSYFRADEKGTKVTKLFDIEVESAVGNRVFLPVLFREPKVVSPPRRPPPLTGRRPATSPLIVPPR